jgi:hypothetical protein
MKFLCICEMGSVRSVAMAIALKESWQEALAAGWRTSKEGTLKMLCDWADAIIVMQADIVPLLEGQMGKGGFDPRKLVIVDVGPDIYGSPVHSQLINSLRSIVADWRGQGFALTSALGNKLPLAKA